MSDPKSDSTKSVLIPMSIAGLLILGIVVFVILHQHKSTGFISDLHQYYPENTAFYMEISPGEKLSVRLLKGLDRLRALRSQTPSQEQASMKTLFKKDFQPMISVGVWLPEPQGKPDATNHGTFLMVIPTRSGLTAETLVSDLKLPLSAVNITHDGGATFLQSKTDSHPVLALYHDHLLAAYSQDTVKQALAIRQSNHSLLDNPLYKKNLTFLPQERQGTVLALTGQFQKLPDSNLNNPSLQKLIAFQRQIQAATPVMVGSLTINKDQFIHFDSFTPVDFSRVSDQSFRDDIKTLYQKQAVFDLPKFLPEDTVLYGGMLGLGQYYDIYANHIATQEGKDALANVDNQLKMVGLDLRKDIIGLLDGKSAIGVISHHGQPDVLLFLNNTSDTQKALSQLGTMAAQLTGGKFFVQKMDQKHDVKVLQTPSVPVKIAYSDVEPDTLALGTQSAMEKMYTIEQKKDPSLNDNKLYQELTASMPKQVNGVFFVDFQKSAALLDDVRKMAHAPQAAQFSKTNFQTVLSGIDGVAGANTMDLKNNVLNGHITVKLTGS